MSMSRRDFELLAQTLKNIRACDEFKEHVELTDYVANRIANALDTHCGTFDKSRFLAACKPKEPK